MIFTTVKKRVEKEELFPDDAIMALVDNKFSLNKKAMELFGFPLNKANESRIANGFDENNVIILSTMDTKDMYTNNVTAKNEFSSQLLVTRLAKQFSPEKIIGDTYFQLNLIEDDDTYKYIGLELINAINVPFQQREDTEEFPEPGFYAFVPEIFTDKTEQEELQRGITIIDEIAQEEGIIEESPSINAEVEEIAEFPKIEGVPSNLIPNEINYKKVINTESW